MSKVNVFTRSGTLKEHLRTQSGMNVKNGKSNLVSVEAYRHT